MEFITHISDFVYPQTPIHITRDTARGIIFKDGKIAVLHITGTDIFGKRNHWETPGGGIEPGETPEEALRREIQEELGYTITNIQEIGIISNDYYRINRCDRAHFFSADAVTFTAVNYTEEEKHLVNTTIWLDTADIVARYEDSLKPSGTPPVQNCGKIIHTRDVIAIKRALAARSR